MVLRESLTLLAIGICLGIPMSLGRRHTIHWDDPELKKTKRRGSRPK
jgi:hypothetical protein